VEPLQGAGLPRNHPQVSKGIHTLGAVTQQSTVAAIVKRPASNRAALGVDQFPTKRNCTGTSLGGKAAKTGSGACWTLHAAPTLGALGGGGVFPDIEQGDRTPGSDCVLAQEVPAQPHVNGPIPLELPAQRTLCLPARPEPTR
jgi:hypothetical protein